MAARDQAYVTESREGAAPEQDHAVFETHSKTHHNALSGVTRAHVRRMAADVRAHARKVRRSADEAVRAAFSSGKHQAKVDAVALLSHVGDRLGALGRGAAALARHAKSVAASAAGAMAPKRIEAARTALAAEEATLSKAAPADRPAAEAAVTKARERLAALERRQRRRQVADELQTARHTLVTLWLRQRRVQKRLQRARAELAAQASNSTNATAGALSGRIAALDANATALAPQVVDARERVRRAKAELKPLLEQRLAELAQKIAAAEAAATQAAEAAAVGDTDATARSAAAAARLARLRERRHRVQAALDGLETGKKRVTPAQRLRALLASYRARLTQARARRRALKGKLRNKLEQVGRVRVRPGRRSVR